MNSLFNNIKVGVSISDSEELAELGFSNLHLQDIMVELTRYLLNQGANLVYGGDLRAGGYTEIFAELALWYTKISNSTTESPIENYFPWPTHLGIKRSVWREWKKNRIKPVRLDPPADLPIDKDIAIATNSVENRYYWSRSLSYMREQIVNICDARVLIGGKSTNYKGRMPGLLEEAFLTTRQDKPLYLIGGFGGVSTEVIKLLQGKSSDKLTLDYQIKANLHYQDLVDFIQEKKSEHYPDYDVLSLKLTDYGIKNLAKANGLSEDENYKLFHSTYIPEIVFLIIKGLTSLNKSKSLG